MKALVTGGAGFIGSHLCELLKVGGHQVLVVDDLSTGKPENLPAGVTLEVGTVGQVCTEAFLRKTGVDTIFHHAAQINVRRSIENPVFDAQTNIVEGIQLLENCRRAGVRRMVYASTGGAIYGEPPGDSLPVSEACAVEPLSAYGISKYAFEHYLRLYARLYGFRTSVLRYANVYGPRQDPHGEAGVVAIFLTRILNGGRPIIFGDGMATRDYVYVEDVARANLLAAEELEGEVYNIGTGLETSVLQLLQSIEAAVKDASLELPHGGGAEHAAERPGEVSRIALDCGYVQKRLGWKPEVELSEGIRRTLASFRTSVSI